MILTGKAKRAFIDHHWQSKFKEEDYKEYEEYLDKAEVNHLYSDIIEWLDSVGIYVEIYIWHRDEGNMYFGWNVGDFDGCLCSHNKLKAMSRQEATEEAIIKANDLYNETK